MALKGPIAVTFEQVFPHGCYVVGEVEKVKEFYKKKDELKQKQ